MEEARPIAAGGRHFLFIAHSDADLLQQALVVVQLFDVLGDREVVARLDPREMRGNDLLHRRAASSQQIASGFVTEDAHRFLGDDQLLLPQRTVLHIPAEQTLGVVLRFLHIGLIEGIDAEQRSRNRGGELPQEKSSPRSRGSCSAWRNTGWPAPSSAASLASI